MILKLDADNKARQEVDKKIHKVISEPYNLSGDATEVSVGISVGIAFFPEDGTDHEHLMKIADERMYMDKQKSAVSNY